MTSHGKIKVALLAFAYFWVAGCAESDVPPGETANGWDNSERHAIILSEDQIQTKRLSRQSIQITWSDALDGEVESYSVKRCAIGEDGQKGDWSIVGEVCSDGIPGESSVSFVDNLPDETIRQFVYAIDLKLRAGVDCSAKQSQPVLASNWLVCVDPGHYAGVNQIEGEYTEGDAMLCLGRALCAELKAVYGIDSCMTRTEETITLGGYSNQNLDSAHLGLRGRYAGEMDSDLLISLHTNANEDNANGYATCAQPIGINKPILIINQEACFSDIAVQISNSIGTNLAQSNLQCEVSSGVGFRPVALGKIGQWSEAYNDGLDLPGTVFYRLDEHGREYYGVLRGASDVGVPAIIIEHGMHTVPEVRKAATTGDLLMRWAEADARGIAHALGFLSYEEIDSR